MLPRRMSAVSHRKDSSCCRVILSVIGSLKIRAESIGNDASVKLRVYHACYRKTANVVVKASLREGEVRRQCACATRSPIRLRPATVLCVPSVCVGQ